MFDGPITADAFSMEFINGLRCGCIMREKIFCFPKDNVSVTKARLATEELYNMKKKRRVKTADPV